MPGICSICGERTGILTQNLEKLEICKFGVFKFLFSRDYLPKKISHLHLCHIYIINTNTLIQSQIGM